ncbi:hypothetical protein RJT34_24900 [Clitoria ternatea]|uniref:Uncharacterized protein n=1 Tax=Clitoria ternatea TaxID=43366 RepID=A0AAN9FRK9_CLITE
MILLSRTRRTFLTVSVFLYFFCVSRSPRLVSSFIITQIHFPSGHKHNPSFHSLPAAISFSTPLSVSLSSP